VQFLVPGHKIGKVCVIITSTSVYTVCVSLMGFISYTGDVLVLLNINSCNLKDLELTYSQEITIMVMMCTLCL